jgi:hypothetical protein
MSKDSPNKLIVDGYSVEISQDEMMALFDAVMETDLGTDLDAVRKKIKPLHRRLCEAYERRHPEMMVAEG